MRAGLVGHDVGPDTAADEFGKDLGRVAEQTDGQMIMTIVGTKTSDKTVTTRTEVLETYKPETVTKTDSSMEAGDSRVETSGITGYSTKTYKQITENGKTTEVLANSSTYSKRDEVVYVGE